MKKILLLSLVLSFASISFAQSIVIKGISDQDSLKASAHDFSVNVDFTPFNGAKIVSMKAINLRYFLKDDIALRFGFNIDYNSLDEDSSEYTKTNFGDVVNKTFDDFSSSTTQWGINIGFEKHFKGTNRLSPYLGIDFVYNNFSSQMEASKTFTNIKAAYTVRNKIKTEGSTSPAVWKDVLNDYTIADKLVIDEPANRSFTEIGLNVVAGLDFYVIKHLYLGVEMGLGFKNRYYGDVSAKNYSIRSYSDSSLNDDEIGENKMQDVTLPNKSFFSFSKNINTAIKLGFVF